MLQSEMKCKSFLLGNPLCTISVNCRLSPSSGRKFRPSQCPSGCHTLLSLGIRKPTIEVMLETCGGKGGIIALQVTSISSLTELWDKTHPNYALLCRTQMPSSSTPEKGSQVWRHFPTFQFCLWVLALRNIRYRSNFARFYEPHKLSSSLQELVDSEQLYQSFLFGGLMPSVLRPSLEWLS
jgi:hypothetical protein